MVARRPSFVVGVAATLVASVATVVVMLRPLAEAASFTVNTTLDTEDARPGDGKCADADRGCSFRAALTEANASKGNDTIALPAGAFTVATRGADDVNATGDYDIVPGDGSKITIVGAGTGVTTLDGGGLERVLHVLGGTAEVRNLTLRGGAADSGAAALVASGAHLALRDVEVRDHTGRVSALSSEGTLDAARITVSATAGGGAGLLVAGGSARVANATITGNSGAGIRVTGGTLVVNNATIAVNTGSGVTVESSGRLKMGATIVSANAGTQCTGRVESRGDNVVAGTSCSPAATDLAGADPKLGALALNGGATRTMLPAGTSAVVDAVGADKCQVTDDQRGRRRPVDGNGDGKARCDVGAVELDTADLASTTTKPPGSTTTKPPGSTTTKPPASTSTSPTTSSTTTPTTQPPAQPVTDTPSLTG